MEVAEPTMRPIAGTTRVSADFGGIHAVARVGPVR
jgi:hypothetical protein